VDWEKHPEMVLISYMKKRYNKAPTYLVYFGHFSKKMGLAHIKFWKSRYRKNISLFLNLYLKRPYFTFLLNFLKTHWVFVKVSQTFYDQNGENQSK
jgi:hypothetical protein